MKVVQKIFKDRLYGNSLWLIANSVAITSLGFFFWMIVTRAYAAEQVGLATALLATTEIIVILSLLGLDIALIRYLPKTASKDKMVNSAFSLSVAVSLAISLIVILTIEMFLPNLAFIQNSLFGVLFMLFSAFNVVFVLIESVFIALGRSASVFTKNVIFSILKLMFPFLLLAWGAFGIFSSVMIALIISFFAALLLLKCLPLPEISKKILGPMLGLSFINYLSRLFALGTVYILPLIITSVLSPTMTAYFYIDWMIVTSLFMIPYSIGQALLAEGSRAEESMPDKIKKALAFTYALLIPAAIIVIIFAKYLLLLFGPEYSENASLLLQVLALSSIPFAINSIYIAVKNVNHEPRKVLVVNIFVSVSTLALSYVLMERGILMVGLAWLAIQMIAALRNATLLWRDMKNG